MPAPRPVLWPWFLLILLGGGGGAAAIHTLYDRPIPIPTGQNRSAEVDEIAAHREAERRAEVEARRVEIEAVKKEVPLAADRGNRKPQRKRRATEGKVVEVPPQLRGGAGPWYDDSAGYDRALAEHVQNNRPLLLYFRTDWCSVCRRFDNAILPAPASQPCLSSVAKVRINPERGAREKSLAKRFGVNGYPALFLVGSVGATPRTLHNGLGGGANPAKFNRSCLAAMNN